MSTPIILPKVGFSMQEGTIAEWLVRDGTVVRVGQPLYVLEDQKATTDVESPASGVLKILKPAGETYEVGAILGEIA